MEKNESPPQLRSSVQRARNFYLRCNAMPLYEHCHEVMRTAADVGIVEGRVIADKREDPKRQWANSVIAETILYHSTEFESLGSSGMRLPPALRDERVLRELEIYCKLTKLERSGAPLSEFVPLLNNGQAPLALLGKIADYAVTHNSSSQLEGMVGKWPNGLFRTYSTAGDLEQLLKMDAKAGEMIYAPVAELFGYPDLAGDILKHSYHVNHPEIHALVMRTLAEEMVMQRLIVAQRAVRELSGHLKASLRSFGFDADVTVRMQKHEGKLMRKALLKAGEKQPESSQFDVEKISDWVALRLVISRYKGKDIDHLPEDQKRRTIKAAVGLVETSLETMNMLSGDAYLYSHEFKEKSSGYRAYHWDVRSVRSGLAPEERPMPFEVQLKTSEWHEMAEHGKAAHYYYIGGESEFVDIIARAYKDIIHLNDAIEPSLRTRPSRLPSHHQVAQGLPASTRP